jgi:hypothetical protein
MRLSKTRLLNFLQCSKRLWLEIHRADLAEISADTRDRFETGHQVGAIARKLYDNGTGIQIGASTNLNAALKQTQALLSNPAGESPLLRGQAALPLQREGEGGGSSGSRVFFEAAFEHRGVVVRTDILERSGDRTRLVEVKSSTQMKEEYSPDVAIQTWVLEGAGVRVDDIALAHIDNQFVYRGDGNYQGLLTEEPIGDLARRIAPQVPEWTRQAQQVMAGPEPEIPIGTHCRSPYECPFIGYCWPETDYPLTALPNLGAKLNEYVARGYRDVRDVPGDEVSGEQRLRVWHATVANRPDIHPSLREELRAIAYPRYYLDFETIAPAVPIWPGTRPYQVIPFQWSIHIETSPGVLEHLDYLDLSGGLPARPLAQALLRALGRDGPILAYSRYEAKCLQSLAQLVPMLADSLHALESRLVDLWPIVKRGYYHPAMKGSWSIKAVLPAVVPDLSYDNLGEVQEGNEAQRAYFEAISPETSPQRKEQLQASLLEYCRFDTHALVHVVAELSRERTIPRS